MALLWRLKINILISLSILLTSCANLPPAIQNAPDDDLQFGDVRENVSHSIGSAVRWGGTIIAVENDEDASWVQVLNYQLKGYGRPSLNNTAEGRFIIYSGKFLDPAVYIKGLEVTVAGRLKGETERKIGEKTLKLPIVESKEIHLWPAYRLSNYTNAGYFPYSYGYYRTRFYNRPWYYNRYRFRYCN